MESIITYKIEDKKYTVITKIIKEEKTINKLYDIICEYIISQIN